MTTTAAPPPAPPPTVLFVSLPVQANLISAPNEAFFGCENVLSLLDDDAKRALDALPEEAHDEMRYGFFDWLSLSDPLLHP